MLRVKRSNRCICPTNLPPRLCLPSAASLAGPCWWDLLEYSCLVELCCLICLGGKKLWQLTRQSMIFQHLTQMAPTLFLWPFLQLPCWELPGHPMGSVLLRRLEREQCKC